MPITTIPDRTERIVPSALGWEARVKGSLPIPGWNSPRRRREPLVHPGSFGSQTTAMHTPLRFLFLPLLFGLAGSPTNSIAQETAPKPPNLLLHGYFDASAVPKVHEEMKNSGRCGITATHGSGWGIGYARQRLSWRGDGPPQRYFMWLSGPSWEPKKVMTLHSLMAIKEFHLRSTELFRPCLEAGISFIRLDHDELTVVEYPTGETFNQYNTETTRVLGLDARLRTFLPLSRAFAFEVALHANFNEVESYASFEFGCAVGLVR